MSLLKARRTVDIHGVLTVKLPLKAAGTTVDVIVNLTPKGPAVEEEFLQLLHESFGAIADLRRVDQGELAPPACW